jgi:hypothetical protein
MDDHPQRSGMLDRQLRGSPSFADREQDSLAGGAEHEQAFDPTRTVEVQERLESVFVERATRVTQRSRGRRDRA